MGGARRHLLVADHARVGLGGGGIAILLQVADRDCQSDACENDCHSGQPAVETRAILVNARRQLPQIGRHVFLVTLT